MYKASFKTAYLQRELPNKAVVIGDDVFVNELVKITYIDGYTMIEKISANTVTGALNEATHTIAQSDMTLDYGHVPVEYRDYRYKDIVKSVISINDIKPSTNNAEYLGVYKSVDELPTNNITTGDTALIYDNGILKKYVASADNEDIVWEETSPEQHYDVSQISKNASLYKIINKLDITAYDAEN